jgi:hypothetical protein
MAQSFSGRSGWCVIECVVQVARANAVRAPERAAFTELDNYLRPHAARQNYAERIAAGERMGSSMIEGVCKNLIGRRLKQPGAGWKRENANHITTLGSCAYSTYWKNHAHTRKR